MEPFEKNTLLRVVREPDGNIELDFSGKKSGRGAYICKRVECFRKARKTGRFEKNLCCSIPEEIYNELEKKLELYDK